MKTKHFLSLIAATSVLAANFPAKAQLQLDPKDQAFCNAVHSKYVRDFAQMNSTSKSGGGNIGVKLPIKGIPIGFEVGGNGSGSRQNGTKESVESTYRSKNCDVYIQTQGKVQIAEIEANAARAIEQIRANASMYGEDVKLALGLDTNATNLALGQLNADAAKYSDDTKYALGVDTNATNLERTRLNANAIENVAQTNANSANYIEELRSKVANGQQLTAIEIEKIRAATDKGLQLSEVEKAKINANAQKQNGIVGAVGNIVTAFLNKPKNTDNNQSTTTATPASPQAVAVAPTDRTTQLFAQWGWTKIPCTIGAVFIKGLETETVCINPTSNIPAGEYIFDLATNQLQAVAIQTPEPSQAINTELIERGEDLVNVADDEEVDNSSDEFEADNSESEDFEEDI